MADKQTDFIGDGSSAEFLPGYQDRPEDRSVSSRARERTELSDQVQAFLAQGGKIQEVEPLLRADPPRKPSTEYGGKLL